MHPERNTERQGEPGYMEKKRSACPPECAVSEGEGSLEESCCRDRHKVRTQEEIKALTNRLCRIEGQIRGIRKMVEQDAYCPDILMQSAAVLAAVNSFNRELLTSHIRTCVVRDIRTGEEEGEKAIEELSVLLQRLMK